MSNEFLDRSLDYEGRAKEALEKAHAAVASGASYYLTRAQVLATLALQNAVLFTVNPNA